MLSVQGNDEKDKLNKGNEEHEIPSTLTVEINLVLQMYVHVLELRRNKVCAKFSQ